MPITLEDIQAFIYRGEVANYSALPPAASVPNAFYWVQASQGTKFIGALWGGSYYPAGTYHSNGVSWEYMDTPSQATQSEVDAGIVTDKFVSPATLSNWSSSTAFVPYTGATANVDLGEFELKAGQIELDQSPTGTAGVAVTRWNDTLGSTETTLKGGSVVLKNGVDLVARVVNKVTPNTTLTKAAYQVVKVSGEINTTGSLQGETWVDGDVLYLSPTVAGAMTNIKPTGLTGHIVVLGYVEYAHAIHGKIYVKTMNGWELDELHNCYINPATLANNDVLQYESATSLWKNKPIVTPNNSASNLFNYYNFI